MTLQEMRRQLDNCTGPVLRPLVKPKLTGIERHLQELEAQKLEEISSEYHRTFGDQRG